MRLLAAVVASLAVGIAIGGWIRPSTVKAQGPLSVREVKPGSVIGPLDQAFGISCVSNDGDIRCFVVGR